jgi:putative transposase
LRQVLGASLCLDPRSVSVATPQAACRFAGVAPARSPQHFARSSIAPTGVRRIIYTTNAIEALNSKLRRAVRTRGHFPSDDAAAKLLYLVLNHAAAEWKRPPREWAEAKTQFAVMFKERFVRA